MKTCSKCKVILTSENGYVKKSGRREGEFHGYCKVCNCQKNSDRYPPKPSPLPEPFNMKTCPKCGILKEVLSFYVRRDTGKLKTPCRECIAKYKKERNYKYPPNSTLQRAGSLKRKYSLSLEEWDEMLLNQGAQCAICGLEKWLCVDHCHVTNKVRGLLCSGCNMALGVFKDSFKMLHAAANYMEKHSPNS